jgi:5-methylcytosine-specific restriction endonuclease McrA
MKVLLLNKSEEILRIISWKRAACLIALAKATVPYGFCDYYEIRLSRNRTYYLPTAIMLTDYRVIPFKPLKVTKDNLLRRDNFKCQYCGTELNRKTMTIDHLQPLSKGGSSTWDNMVCACEDCNIRKSNRYVRQAGMSLLQYPKVPTREEIVLSYIEHDGRESWSRWIVGQCV